MSSQTLLVLTTCGSADTAQNLATRLVEARLAACVNVIDGVASTYRWQDRVQQDREALLLIKTTEAQLPALEQTIRDESGYELPEVLAVPVAGGSRAYLDWLRESVAAAKD